MATCNKCQAEIKFVKTGDLKADGKPKYLVRNMDGTAHVCGQAQAAEKKDLGPARQGILISVVKSDLKPVSVVIRTEEKGDRTYAVHPTVNLCPDDELPQKINFSVDKTSFATIYSYLGPADLQPTIGDFKTAAEMKSETVTDHRMTVTEAGEALQAAGKAIHESITNPPAPEASAPTGGRVPDNRTDTPETPGLEKARHYGALTGVQKDKLIVPQSNFRTICELVGASGGGLSFDLIWEKTTEITNKMLVEAVKE